jgi:hypothetical protein
VALAAGIVVPRADLDRVALEAGARRLADDLTLGRERAILGGAAMRVVLDVDAGRWRLGRAGREPLAIGPDGERPSVLSSRVSVRAVRADAAPVVRAGTVAIDLAPDGDAHPLRIELADRGGRTRTVLLPAGGARARLLERERP